MLAHFGQNTQQDSHNTQKVTEDSNLPTHEIQNIAEDQIAQSQNTKRRRDSNLHTHNRQTWYETVTFLVTTLKHCRK